CPESKKEFDVLGTMDDVPSAKLVSDRFEVGRNFCNKVWNAARFAFINLTEVGFEPRAIDDLYDEDRWILSRLSSAIEEVQSELAAYNPANAIGCAREFFWSELCDWYLELIKPRMRSEEEAPLARQVLATVLDQILRMLHPFVPFITEALWAKLGEHAPERGVDQKLSRDESLMTSAWPTAREDLRDSALEERFDFLQDVVRGVRDIRAKYSVPPSEKINVRVRAEGASQETLSGLSSLFQNIAGVESLEISSDV
ncbi:MAG: class I tRNA ligase family protein, partial [Planctomycetota bacterium]